LVKRGIVSAALVHGKLLFSHAAVLFIREHYRRPIVEVEPTIWEEMAEAKRAPIAAQIDELLAKSLALPPAQLAQLVATLQRQDAERTGEASAGAPVDLEVEQARRAARHLRSVQGGRAS
jgi:hypothetical protein